MNIYKNIILLSFTGLLASSCAPIVIKTTPCNHEYQEVERHQHYQSHDFNIAERIRRSGRYTQDNVSQMLTPLQERHYLIHAKGEQRDRERARRNRHAQKRKLYKARYWGLVKSKYNYRNKR